ncbi:unnamed protein product [Amaranthus hypochondriacus]
MKKIDTSSQSWVSIVNEEGSNGGEVHLEAMNESKMQQPLSVNGESIRALEFQLQGQNLYDVEEGVNEGLNSSKFMGQQKETTRSSTNIHPTQNTQSVLVIGEGTTTSILKFVKIDLSDIEDEIKY